MNAETESAILDKLEAIAETQQKQQKLIDALAATPANRRAIAEAQTRDRIMADLDEIDALAKAGPDERAAIVLAMRPKRLQELRGMVSDKIEIARDLPIDARRKWLAGIDRTELSPIVAALHPSDQLPDVVRARASGEHKVEWKILDEDGSCVEGYTLQGEREFLDLERDHFEALVSECAELRDALAANRLTVESLDEQATRQWLASQLRLGELYAVQDYEVVIVEEDEPEVREVDAGKAARDRAANAKAPTENPHEELRQYAKRQREGDAERRVSEMAAAFKRAMK